MSRSHCTVGLILPLLGAMGAFGVSRAAGPSAGVATAMLVFFLSGLVAGLLLGCRWVAVAAPLTLLVGWNLAAVLVDGVTEWRAGWEHWGISLTFVGAQVLFGLAIAPPAIVGSLLGVIFGQGKEIWIEP